MGYGVTGLLPRAHVDESNIQGLFAVKEGRMIIFDLAWYEYQTLSSYEVKRLATHGDATEDGITQAADQIKTLPRVRFIREHELIGPRLHDIITHPTEILEHMSGTATSFIGIQQPDCRRDMYDWAIPLFFSEDPERFRTKLQSYSRLASWIEWAGSYHWFDY